MRKIAFRSLSLLSLCLLFACGSEETQDSPKEEKTNSTNAPFTEVPANFETQEVLIPEGFSMEILFMEGKDKVKRNDGTFVPAQGNHDLNVYFPEDENGGRFYVSHEADERNDDLGDGGGGTFFQVVNKQGKWSVEGDFMAVDFSQVGGTWRNCGGTGTPNGTVLTAEEGAPTSNLEIVEGFRDTSDFDGRPRNENFGWMVEVPQSGTGLKKLYKMGRFDHEDAEVMDDNRTVFLTDDATPAVFFKFVATEAGNFEEGQLYAYQQSEDGKSGAWLELPMEMDSLLMIREVAINKGATMFVRHEWLVRDGDKLYIAETGGDRFDLSAEVAAGGQPARHLKDAFMPEPNVFEDPYGRILVFNLKNNGMSVLLNGGTASNDASKTFSNPDCITSVNWKGKTWLVINEDIIGLSKNRVGKKALVAKKAYNEIYFLDATLTDPSLNDLHRFLVAPRGAETTGGLFSPDGKSYFVNIQHPSSKNEGVWNRSATIVIQGF